MTKKYSDQNTQTFNTSPISESKNDQEINRLYQALKDNQERLDTNPFNPVTAEATRAVETIIKNDIELLLIRQRIQEPDCSLDELAKAKEKILSIKNENQQIREALAKMTSPGSGTSHGKLF